MIKKIVKLSLHLSLCGMSREENVFKPMAMCDLFGKPSAVSLINPSAHRHPYPLTIHT